MDTKKVAGSCLCGAVAYQVEGAFLSFQYCHCSRCRKSSGTAHMANGFIKIAQFSWTRGEDVMRRFELPDAQHYCTGFCSQCGSSLPWVTRNGKYVLIPMGTLDEDPGVEPTHSIFWASRAPWYVSVDALPKHDEDRPRG